MKLELDPKLIDPNALDIIQQLQNKKYTTYLVGGCVRDLLVGLKPKDFDIVTMALPEQVQRIVRPSFLIGRRFRLVLVRRYGQQFEVSTFRSLSYQNEGSDTVDENIYGEPKEDALRRDFTINGLFYDPSENEIIDYTEGLQDIRNRVVRMIGDPLLRIEQDPIRILRALRFAHKIGFSLDQDLRSAIAGNSQLLKGAVLPRVREEILKILRLDDPATALWEAFDLQILKHIMPSFHQLLEDPVLAQQFFRYFAQGLELVRGSLEPTALYSVFMYSYLATLNEEWTHSLSPRIEESVDPFMRLELGMHRVESEIFFQAMNLIKQISKNPSPEKLRARHRDHLLTNRAFELALGLASAYHYLGHNDVYRWQQLLAERPVQKDHRR